MADRVFATLSFAERAAARGAWLSALDRGMAGVVVGVVVGVGAVAIGPVVAWPWAWWWSLVVAPIAGGAGGGVSALFTRWSAVRAAREVEKRLSLHDQLSSALLLSRSAGGDPFVRVAMDEADRLSTGIDLAAVFPVRVRRWWAAAPAMVVAGIGTGLWMPSWGGGSGGIEARVEARVREDAGSALSEMLPLVREAAPTAVAGASEREIASLEEVQRELAAGRVSPGEAASRSAQAVERVAERVEARSRDEIAEFDRLRQKLAEAARDVNSSGEGANEEQSAIRRALAAGDVPGAARAADEAVRAAESMSPERRRALADDLAQLARELGKPGNVEPSREGEAGSQQRSDGRSSDPSRQAERDSAGARPEAGQSSEKRLSRSLDDAAKELKDRPGQETEKRAGDNKPREETDAPERSDGQPKSGREETGAKKAEGSGKSGEGATRDASGSKEPGSSGESRSEAQSNPGAKDGSRSDETGPARQVTGPEAAQRDKGEPESGQGKGTDRGDARGERDGEGAKSQRGAQTGRPDQATREESSRTPSSDPRGRPALERLAKELKDLGSKPGAARSNSERARELRERAREMLDRASPEQREELERVAREMQDRSPEKPKSGAAQQSREGKDRGEVKGSDRPGVEPEPEPGSGESGVGEGRSDEQEGEQDGSSSPGGGLAGRDGWRPRESDRERGPVKELGSKTQIVDARPKSSDAGGDGRGLEPETVISSWSGPPDGVGRKSGAGTSAVGERFRSAAAGAERSVEQQVVPSRYGDLVRRVFRRYVDRTRPGLAEPAQAAPTTVPDATDVVRPK